MKLTLIQNQFCALLKNAGATNEYPKEFEITLTDGQIVELTTFFIAKIQRHFRLVRKEQYKKMMDKKFGNVLNSSGLVKEDMDDSKNKP